MPEGANEAKSDMLVVTLRFGNADSLGHIPMDTVSAAKVRRCSMGS